MDTSQDVVLTDRSMPFRLVPREVVRPNIGPPVMVSSPGGTCQVCGGELASEIVACPACETHHHRECWDFAGGCATYGCAAAGGD